MVLDLTTELLKHKRLQETLKFEFPEADDETLEDTLEGLTELTEMIAVVLRSHLQDLALIRGLKGRIAEMQARVGRFERRAERKRQLATSVMEQAEIRKLSEPDFTASLRRASPPLLVVDEVCIPVEFWKPQPAKLDRQKLLAMLKAGQDVPGAALGAAGRSLVVRTR
jgi:Siphovirus Gp157